MSHYLLLCKSLTYAQRAFRILERRGITAVIVRAPMSLNIQGCSYCVKVAQRRLDTAIEVLTEAGIEPVKIFHEKDGFYKEVGV